MLYLILAVACSLVVGMIFKVAGLRQLDRMTLLTANYATATILGLTLARGTFLDLNWSTWMVVLGMVMGVLFISVFFFQAWATALAGMSLSISVVRLSVVIPFLASWFIWSERPSIAQGIGLILAGISFVLVARKESEAGSSHSSSSSALVFAVLGLLFLSGGIVDVTLKAYNEEFADGSNLMAFLVVVFGVAFLTGLSVMVSKGSGRPERAAVMWGALLGAINLASAAFFLQAVRILPGTFVFPVHNIALVIGGAVIGVLVWRERLSRLNLIGLALAGFALLLLGQ